MYLLYTRWYGVLKLIVLVIIPSCTTIIISRIITTTDSSGLECIGSHSITSFPTLRVEMVVPSIREVVVTWLLLKRRLTHDEFPYGEREHTDAL